MQHAQLGVAPSPNRFRIQTKTFISAPQAIEQLLEVEVAQQGGETILCADISRLQADDQQLVAGPMRKLLDVDFGAPLHCLVIAGDVHVVEEETVAY